MAMPAAATQIRTIEDATQFARIERARSQLLATALADALAEAKAKGPDACERIEKILGKAREQHLIHLRERA